MSVIRRLVPTTRRLRALSAIVLILLLAATWLVVSRDSTRRLTADFVSSVGVYQGSEVRLMGVPIGKVTSVTPRGDQVRIVMEYDEKYQLAADARAVIVSPSVVADRFVQLTAPYDGTGRPLADGAVLAVSQTRVPVELDRVFRTAHDLLDALGPRGANDNGSVNRFLEVAAEGLGGNGAELGRMIEKLSGAAGTLGAGSDDFFGAVAALEKLTGTLAADDPQVRTFNTRMEQVLGVLAEDRDSLGQVLTELAGTFRVVQDFVKQNRALLTENVTGLVGVTDALVDEKEALEQVIRRVPVGLDNLNRAWDPKMQAVRSRTNELELLKNIDGLLCDTLVSNGVPNSNGLCRALTALFAGLP